MAIFFFIQVNSFINCVGGSETFYGLQPVKSSICVEDQQLSNSLDSLILSILPSIDYEFTVPVMCHNYTESSDSMKFTVPVMCRNYTESSGSMKFLVKEIMLSLRVYAGFNIPEVSQIVIIIDIKTKSITIYYGN